MNSSKIKVKKVELTPDGWTFNILSPRVATITSPTGVRKTTYFGFNSKEKAESFLVWITRKDKCTKAVIRSSERLNTPWEIKVWGTEESLIVKCALKDLQENATIALQNNPRTYNPRRNLHLQSQHSQPEASSETARTCHLDATIN